MKPNNNIVIKSRGGNLYDVFFGREGWDNWACFQKQRNRLLLVKGTPVPNSLYTEITKQILG